MSNIVHGTTRDGPYGSGFSVKRYAQSLDNDYEPFLTQAQATLDAGKAAFWLTSKYHDQDGWNFLGYANEGNGLHAAEIAQEREWQRPFDMPVALLDRLVPLNVKAMSELMDAYELECTWRTRAEIASRCPFRLGDRETEMRKAS